ncbi:MAG: hypothetical protein ABR540_22280 [Acidimicrobiales bacterium]
MAPFPGKVMFSVGTAGPVVGGVLVAVGAAGADVPVAAASSSSPPQAASNVEALIAVNPRKARRRMASRRFIRPSE